MGILIADLAASERHFVSTCKGGRLAAPARFDAARNQNAILLRAIRGKMEWSETATRGGRMRFDAYLSQAFNDAANLLVRPVERDDEDLVTTALSPFRPSKPPSVPSTYKC